jgi:hypothetical protein
VEKYPKNKEFYCTKMMEQKKTKEIMKKKIGE